MAQAIRRRMHFPVRHRDADYADTVDDATVIERDYAPNMAARIVWFVTSALLALLAIRFLFALLGANPNNGFANFIYNVSHPFVAPFFNLFSFNYQYGISKFETYTLVAMLIYGLIGYGLARLLTLNRRY